MFCLVRNAFKAASDAELALNSGTQRLRQRQMADTEPALPFAGVPKQVVYENTYITSPDGYGPVSRNMCSVKQPINRPAKTPKSIALAECGVQKIQGPSCPQADAQREDGVAAV